jgi:hypothetical protein
VNPSSDDGPAHAEILAGGVANAGRVLRVGDEVSRPAGPHSPTIQRLLHHVRDRGFDGVPRPLALEGERERLVYIPGAVPVVPFPPWSQTVEVLASTCALLRRFHDATVDFEPPGDATWNRELADPEGGPVVCHNDVCPENVVYRNGQAIALLDFDFAAPGRRVFDLASLARMCVPIETDEDAARTGRGGLDPFARLRVAADAYDLPPDRHELVDVLEQQFAQGGAFVRRRVEAGEPAFVEMWTMMGGQERFERRQAWFATNRQRFLDALH